MKPIAIENGKFLNVPKYIFQNPYQETIHQIIEIYKKDERGGALHVVLDDGNNEKSNIEFCREAIEESDYDPDTKELFMSCADNLLKIDNEHRVGLVEWVAFQYVFGRAIKDDNKKYGEN